MRSKEDIYTRFFTRFGSPAESSDVAIHIYLKEPGHIQTIEDVARYDKMCADDIGELEAYLEALKKIRVEYQKRYMYLSTAATKTAIRLRRRKDCYSNLVTYYLETVTTRIDDKTELVEIVQQFSGKERSAAFKAFEAYKKSHPGIEAIQDTEKSRWEH